jgi:hypothetical protein
MYSLAYYILKMLNLDYPIIIYYCPKFISSIFAAIFDIYILKLVELTIGKKYLKITLLINIFNIVSFNRLAKGLINNFETAIFTAAFYYWQLSLQKAP